MSDGFTVFAVDSPRTLNTLKKRLTERRLELLSNLQYATDWNHHQRMVGSVNGIEEVIAMLADIEKQEQ